MTATAALCAIFGCHLPRIKGGGGGEGRCLNSASVTRLHMTTAARVQMRDSQPLLSGKMKWWFISSLLASLLVASVLKVLANSKVEVPNVAILTDKNFETEVVLRKDNKPVIVKFHAPCNVFSHVM